MAKPEILMHPVRDFYYRIRYSPWKGWYLVIEPLQFGAKCEVRYISKERAKQIVLENKKWIRKASRELLDMLAPELLEDPEVKPYLY